MSSTIKYEFIESGEPSISTIYMSFVVGVHWDRVFEPTRVKPWVGSLFIPGISVGFAAIIQCRSRVNMYTVLCSLDPSFYVIYKIDNNPEETNPNDFMSIELSLRLTTADLDMIGEAASMEPYDGN